MGATLRSCGSVSIVVRVAGLRTAAIAISRTPSAGSAGTLESSMTFDAASWHDYFLMVGGGAAALTGLVFVAMSIHLDQIALNAAHRHRARTVLSGLTAVFSRCALILMAGQSAQMVALDVILVRLGVEFVLYRSIRQATAASDVPDAALVWRTIGSFACLVLEQIGAVALFVGDARGLYVVSIGMMASFIFMVSGAWLLIVGVRREEAAQATA